MKLLFLGILILSSFSLVAISDKNCPSPSESAEEKKPPGPGLPDANAAAIHFLNIVDNRQYSGSWQEAGGLLQDITTKDQWAGGLQSTRHALGQVRTRVLSSKTTSTDLPGGTRGDFVTIKYKTQFAQDPNAVETVVLMRSGKLGLWKVISYSVGKQ